MKNSIALGNKIKEARIAKKMTQSEVVGSYITRNMLSQIENGTANPSIKTLQYLSNVLDLPMSQLMSHEKEAVQWENPLSFLLYAKKLLKEERYELLMEQLSEYPKELSDECQAILCRTYLHLAKEAESREEYNKASIYIAACLELVDKGIYANASLKAEGILFLHRLTERLNELL